MYKTDKTGLFKVVSAAAVCLLSILLLTSCAGHDSSSNKFSNARWTVIGAYDEPQKDSCPMFYDDQLAASGGEYKISADGLPAGIKNSVQVRARDGIIDFTEAYPGKSWAVAYAYLEFEGHGEECFFRMGSDDGLRVWVNGTLVVDDHSHRALDPNSNSFHAVLKNGTNRILVKVCQGEQGWEFSLRDTTRKEHEAFLSDAGGINLSISSRSHFISDSRDLAFSVLANPAPLTDIPFSYYASDSEGNTVASGIGSLRENITIPLPSAKTEYINVRVESGTVGDSLTKEKLGQTRIESLFFTGDPGTVLPAYSAKARKAAGELKNNSSLSTLKADEQNAIKDIAPTLLYLADTIDRKLKNITVSEDKQIRSVLFVNDMLLAMEKGPQALLKLTGYRQMAYLSDIDNSIQPYSLYLPESYSPDKKYSLAVMLHGYSENDYDFGIKLASLMPDDFIIVSVFGRGDLYYQSAGEQDVLDVMDRIIERYPIDENRIYLMGSSMGGLGTWRMGTLYADRFAAVAPFCGWTGYELLDNLGNTKTYIVHGNADDTVSVEFDRNCAKKLKRLGYDASYVEIEDGSHNAWSEWSREYPPETILDIFRSASRNPSPAHLAATIPQVRYGRYYWITVDELDTSGTLVRPEYTALSPYGSFYPPHPGPGKFKADRSEDGSIIIVTDRINALSIDLKAAYMSGTNASKAAIKKITIDGISVEVPAGSDILHLAKQKDNTWCIDKGSGIDTSGTDKGAGANALPTHDGGGIADLFTKPLIIVYGTQDRESAHILEAAARGLADWSPIYEFPIGMKTGIYTVKSDKELTAEDMSTHNILLFGAPGENSISRQISGTLAPYYNEGIINVGGKNYAENGLCITLPNPLAAGKLIGYIDCTKYLKTADAAEQYFFEFQFRLRNCYMNELMGYPTFCPDVFVMTPHPFQDEWAGWFDRNWGNLQGCS